MAAGSGSKANFKLIHELAGAIGGAVGASRAAVDGGYISKDHQIGQTGTTVRPALYIAAGISGAVQHRAGMEESAKIIAINTDARCPDFLGGPLRHRRRLEQSYSNDDQVAEGARSHLSVAWSYREAPGAASFRRVLATRLHGTWQANEE